jgi:hypothetical protein
MLIASATMKHPATPDRAELFPPALDCYCLLTIIYPSILIMQRPFTCALVYHSMLAKLTSHTG